MVPATNKRTITLPCARPFDFRQVTAFLKPRAIPEVEFADGDRYCRSIDAGNGPCLLSITAGGGLDALTLECSGAEDVRLGAIAAMVKNIFDLDAPVQAIDKHLCQDPLLRTMVKKAPGIRVPGACDPFELCVRAVIGQQISVKGATTIVGRLAARHGRLLTIPNPCGINRTFPAPETLARSDLDGLGLTGARVATIRHLARAFLAGKLDFGPSTDRVALKKALLQVKGIGPWTAQYILMRTVKDPDAMPLSDLGLLKAVSADGRPVPETQFKRMSSTWKPWRAYAAMHLWANL